LIYWHSYGTKPDQLTDAIFLLSESELAGADNSTILIEVLTSLFNLNSIYIFVLYLTGLTGQLRVNQFFSGLIFRQRIPWLSLPDYPEGLDTLPDDFQANILII